MGHRAGKKLPRLKTLLVRLGRGDEFLHSAAERILVGAQIFAASPGPPMIQPNC
jgi:hypothetical protein